VAYGQRKGKVLDLAHVALDFDVDEEKLRQFSSRIGHDVQLHVLSIAENTSVQTARVEINSESRTFLYHHRRHHHTYKPFLHTYIYQN